MFPDVPRCAVLLAIHNGSKFIEQQVLSILGQTGVEVQIFFSDDSSDDDGVSKLLATAPNAVDVNHTRRLLGGSFENFLHLLIKAPIDRQYDYIFFSDQDDIWLPTKMQRATEVLALRGGGYSSGFFSFRGHSVSAKYVDKSYALNRYDFVFRSPGPGFTYAFSIDAFEKVRARCSELKRNFESINLSLRWWDWFVYYTARTQNISWYIDDRAFTLYRQHQSNDTGVNAGFKAAVNRLKFLFDGRFHKEVLVLSCFLRGEPGLFESLSRMDFTSRLRLLRFVPYARQSFIKRLLVSIFFLVGRKCNQNGLPEQLKKLSTLHAGESHKI